MSTKDFDTLQLHAGQEQPDSATGSRAVPIYATSSYVFDSAQHAADTFAAQSAGTHANQYGRMNNPTVSVLEERIMALEKGTAAVAFCSGQAATTAILFALAQPDAHFVFSNQIFGGTTAVNRKILEPWGCTVNYVAPNADDIANAIQDNTVGVWVETLSNPSCTVPNLKAISEVCKTKDVPFIVDNTWGCGGYICQPIDHGADIVMHSTTKWIGGHGTFVGGAVVDAGTYNWANGKFPAFTKKDGKGRTYISRAKDGKTAFAVRVYDLGLFTMGMTPSPFSAFQALQGLETLSLRVQRSCDTALELAKWLEAHPKIKAVHYAGLSSHPCFEHAQATLQNGYGAVLSFETHDKASAWQFLDNTKVISHLANIGDSKTVAINCWTTTHASLPEEARYTAGVSPELIRLSVGLESLEDLKVDIEQALT